MRKITKRAVACFLVLLMMLLMMPVMAFATSPGGDDTRQGSSKCHIVGGKYYDSLADAIGAVPSDGTEKTITMLDDVTLIEELTIGEGKKITLDLNGKTIENAATGFEFTKTGSALASGVPVRFMIVNYGDVTICDNSEKADGKISAKNYNYGTTKAILVYGDGKLTVNSGCIHGGYAAIYVIGNTAKSTIDKMKYPELEVNGGTITGEYGVSAKGATAQIIINDGATITATGEAAVSTNGTTDWYDGGHNKIIINGGNISSTGEEGMALYNPSDNTVEIKGGTLRAATAVGVKGGNVIISGNAELIATGAKIDAEAANSGATCTGDALYIEDTYPDHTPVVNVYGGKFYSKNGYAVQYYTTKENEAPNKGTINLYGGYYNENLNAPLTEHNAYIATGYYCINTPITDPNHVDYPYMIGTSDVDEGFNEKSTADVPKGAEEGVADAVKEEALREIVNNTAVTEEGATNINDEDIQKALDEIIQQMVKYSSYLQITVKSVETKTEEKKVSAIKASTITTTSAKYDVKPYVTITAGDETKTVEITNEQLKEALDKDPNFKITFRLAIPESMKGDYVAVSHYPDGKDKADWTKEYKVLGKGANRYVELSATSFSVYEVAQTTHKNPETGNNNNVGLFVGLGGLSLLGIIALAVLMLKKKSYR